MTTLTAASMMSERRWDESRVQRDGIRFASTRYISPVLAAYVGEDLTVRYDHRDLGEIRVYHDNAFLCRVIAPELSSETFTFADLQTARTKQRRTLKQQLRDLTSLADSLPTDMRHQPNAQPRAEFSDEPRHHPRRRHPMD